MSPALPDPLARIRYVALDPTTDRRIGDFAVRADVPLPVEIEGSPAELTASGLSWESIISAMLKILAYDPGHRDAAYFREFITAVRPDIDAELTRAAVAKSQAKGFDVAVEAFRSLRGLEPTNARHAVNLAVVYEERAAHLQRLGREEDAEGDIERAFTCYRQALETDPTLADGHLYLAHFHIRQQSFERAHAELEAYLALEPADSRKRADALAVLREIETRNLMDDLFKSAYDYIRMGQEEKGITRVTEFLAANPDVWNGWFLLGWARRRLRRYAEARDAFRRVLDLGERTIDALNELAICSLELGELGEARAYLEEALGKDTENVKVLSNLAVLSLREGKRDDAAVYFRLVLDIDPDDPVASAGLKGLPQAPRARRSRPPLS